MKLIPAILIAVATFVTEALAQDPCVEFFLTSQRDIRALDSDEAALAEAENQLCQSISTNKSLSRGLNFVLAKARINFEGKSDKQKIEEFCSFAKDRSWWKKTISSRESLVVRESLAAFNACQSINQGDARVSQVYGSPSHITVKFHNPRQDVVVNLLKVQYNPDGTISCDLTFGESAPIPLTRTSSPVEIRGKPFVVACSRAPIEQTQTATIYARETVVITTSLAGFEPMPVTFPSEAIEPASMAPAKDQEIARLHSLLKEERARFDATVAALTPVDAKSFVITSNMELPVYPAHRASVRDLRSSDLEPGAPCDGVRSWGEYVPLAANTLCKRESLVFKGTLANIFMASGGACGRNAYLITCATR